MRTNTELFVLAEKTKTENFTSIHSENFNQLIN